VSFFGVKIADYGQNYGRDRLWIAHHHEPALENDSNTACVDCDSNTISVPHKIISSDKVNVSEPLSQLHHANALSRN